MRETPSRAALPPTPIAPTSAFRGDPELLYRPRVRFWYHPLFCILRLHFA
jgi:hypothetical protein